MKDAQKDRLYAWEDSFWGWDRNLVTLRKCREVIVFACGLYGVDPPTVQQHHKVDISWSLPYAGYRKISLQAKGSAPGKGGLNYPVALHEATHQIIWDYYAATVEDHGAEFVGVYSWLLERAGIAPLAALGASLRDARLKWTYQAPHAMPSRIEPVPLVVGEAAPSLLYR